MAVNNSLSGRQAKETVEKFTYDVNGQAVTLTPQTIRKYLVNGSGNVTDQEVMMFLSICKYQKLNPFLREAYLIKYGNQPATIVTGKEAITKRAMHNTNFEGQQAGIVVMNNDGQLEQRIGSAIMDTEELIGGWAKVYVKGYKVPIEMSVSLAEYIGLKGDGTVNSQWSKRPASMIRKVALVQALKEAFPDDLGGMVSSEETNMDDLPMNIIEETTVETESVTQQMQPAIEQHEQIQEVPQEAVQNAKEALFGKQ